MDTTEYDLAFTCAECGKVATRVRMLEPGEVPEARDEFGASLTSDTQKLCVEVDGMGGSTSPRQGTPQEILRDWLAEDFAALKREEPTQMANYCFQCEEWYCADHLRHERIVYGRLHTTTTLRASVPEATSGPSNEPKPLSRVTVDGTL